MLDGEEKKDCSPLETTMTPNPLAPSSFSYVPAPAMSSSLPRCDGGKTPPSSAGFIVGGAGGVVPNPIMCGGGVPNPPRPPVGGSTTLRGADGATSSCVGMDIDNASSSPGILSPPTLSPLASPIFVTSSSGLARQPSSSASGKDNQQHVLPYDPPSRPGSAVTVGTSASTMDAMASALETPILEEGGGDNDSDYEPPVQRRRRANTIHWATSETTQLTTSTADPLSRTNSQSASTAASGTILRGNETLQPVNFGDVVHVNFGPGTATAAGSSGQQQQQQHRKLSNASSFASSSSLGLRSASSNSLYSEYSCDSGSVGAKSMGSGTPSPSAGASGTAPGAASASPGVVGTSAATPSPPLTSGATVGVAGTVRIAGTAAAVTSTTTFQYSARPTFATTGVTRAPYATGPNFVGKRNPVDKRQKRLERNRESARASRRRRKHYLEELEQRVASLSLEMDRGRANHARAAVRTVRGLRAGRLWEAERCLLAKENVVGGVDRGSGGGGGGGKAGSGGGVMVEGSASSVAAAVKTKPTPVRSGIHHGVAIAAPASNHVASKPPARLGIQHAVKPMMRHPVRTGIAHNVTAVRPAAPMAPPLRGAAASMAKPVNNPVLSLERQVAPLTGGGALSRTSAELQVTQTFLRQQLSSLVQPTSTKFVLWLSLQKDGFYRGGRSASERLSAARIGERLLHSGTLRAAPCDGMWPLVCHEIGLSYDQEERIRQCQRSVLGNSDVWIHRHTALATKNVIESVHAAVARARVAAERREKSLMGILTPEQRVKFLAWTSRKSDVIRRLGESKFSLSSSGGASRGDGASSGEGEYETSPDRHIAANMYIIDHRLSKVKQRAPLDTPNFVHPAKLKKLSRRPALESLAAQQSESDSGNSKLNCETSFPSTGSLKRSLNDALGSGDNSSADPNSTMINSSSQNNGVTPESAYAAGQAAVMAAFSDILPIIPKSALPYAPNPQNAMSVTYPTLAAPSSSPAVASQPQVVQPMLAIFKPQSQSVKAVVPQHHPLPPHSTTTSATTPPLDPDVVDIPMPTPVSVLLRTSDDFISELPYDEPLEAEAVMALPLSTIPANSEFAIPEQATSSYTAPGAGTDGTGLLLSHRHQSAPQLHQPSSPSPDLGYSSLLPAAPMTMIPESSLVNNPIVGQVGVGVGDIGDFALEDLPEMEADDWAIGEGFDMDVDQKGAT
eukprot:CAMPEP_0172532808 /NCGR_PEP_ID=MMETSP1067-20121228/5718_1 /TAXON_ID=265564 ORGANISM="Thalassiosira punctigera, Strain Tpunct2005C2" /NCGR_SAMPLE_ID=MMETSP1067 /ASSEMBLY_ACC=CAM_ASM_000444 /LENGTH=1190 /DNA_ID=CAMNT_0013317361 /DNA_START=74 /DNA_END=3646 /DNA_ORIENTATION=-